MKTITHPTTKMRHTFDGGNATPLQRALDWWAGQDDMAGFRSAAAKLFPAWEPRRSCRAPHREDKTASFSVYQSERAEWRCNDFTDGVGARGLVGFTMLPGMDAKQAARWLMESGGAAASQRQRHSFVPRPIAKKLPREPEKLRPMPVEAMSKWSEGVAYLQGNPEHVETLAAFRGWPIEFAQHLVESGALSMPLYHGQRTLAFVVEVPEIHRNANDGHGRFQMRTVGFHCRLEPRADETKAGWRFVPNEKEHGQRTPALPYILGGSQFDAARLLVIAEGQWDALTFAFAAGWRGNCRAWPEGVCVIGIRGASGINTFLQYYGKFWPSNVNCLLFPDMDGAGSKWFEAADSFADRLAKLCRKVAVVRCGEHKDFNDLYRAQKVTPEQIGELLVSHGMAIGEGTML